MKPAILAAALLLIAPAHALTVLNRGNGSEIKSLDPHFIDGIAESTVEGDLLIGLGHSVDLGAENFQDGHGLAPELLFLAGRADCPPLENRVIPALAGIPVPKGQFPPMRE